MMGAPLGPQAFSDHAQVRDWMRTRNHMDPMLRIDAQRIRAGWLADSSGGKMLGNRNGAFHIAKAPS
jgi:hypothetical protein